MPIYEYQCEKCGSVMEHWQRISDPPVEACEQCGGPVHKLISRSSFHLKGSGWYVTDYGGNRGGSAKSGKDSSAKETKGTEKSKASE